MSLMKLLSVSKSFVAGKNQPGRYRMAEQGLLPKFAPGRLDSVMPKRGVPVSTEGFRLRRNPSASSHVSEPETARPVQPEFALDMVKPIRNDLSDTDFEIVPGGLKENAGERAAGNPSVLRSELAGMVWSRLTARLFNAARARI